MGLQLLGCWCHRSCRRGPMGLGFRPEEKDANYPVGAFASEGGQWGRIRACQGKKKKKVEARTNCCCQSEGPLVGWWSKLERGSPLFSSLQPSSTAPHWRSPSRNCSQNRKWFIDREFCTTKQRIKGGFRAKTLKFNNWHVLSFVASLIFPFWGLRPRSYLRRVSFNFQICSWFCWCWVFLFVFVFLATCLSIFNYTALWLVNVADDGICWNFLSDLNVWSALVNVPKVFEKCMYSQLNRKFYMDIHYIKLRNFK